MNVLALMFLCAMPIAPIQEETFREWKSASGKFAVEAKMAIDSDDVVKDDIKLTKRDGSEITVGYDKLNAASKKYVAAVRRAAKRKAMPPKDDDVSSLPSNSANAAPVWNWRGPNHDGVSPETGLMKQWPKEGPELLWSTDGLGGAMSSIAIADRRIFTLGQRNGAEHLIALNLENGKELWATKFGGSKDSNSTPTVDGNLVYGLGLDGDLVCCDVETGKKIWSKSFANDFGGKMMSSWGFSESPLIDGDQLICTPGGPNAMIVALNKKNWSNGLENRDAARRQPRDRWSWILFASDQQRRRGEAIHYVGRAWLDFCFRQRWDTALALRKDCQRDSKCADTDRRWRLCILLVRLR